MNEEFSEQALKVAQVIVYAARQAGYLLEGEAMQSSPELAALEKPLFVKMFQALKEHLQKGVSAHQQQSGRSICGS